MLAIARDSYLIVGAAVMEHRTPEAMQALADQLPPAPRYCTDGLAIYPELIYPEVGEHILSVGKEETHTVESSIANLRTYLGRLRRASRCRRPQAGGTVAGGTSVRVASQSAAADDTCQSQAKERSNSGLLATPHLVGLFDLHPAQQIRSDALFVPPLREVRAGADAKDAHLVHKPRHRLVVNPHLLTTQYRRITADTVVGVSGVNFVNALPQCQFAASGRGGLVVETGAIEREQFALA